MTRNEEIFLTQAEESVVRKCSQCGEEFHVSRVGPRKPIGSFQKHVREKHANATITRPTYRLKRDT